MTLIVGLLCANGVVLCSDREENAGLVSKRSVKKIHDYSCDEWSICIATSGRGSLADVAARNIISRAKSESGSFIANHVTVITETLIPIMEKHIYSGRFSEKEKGERKFDLIIGLHDSINGYRYLYKTDEEIVMPCDDFACSGYGEDIATYFLDRLFEPAFSRDEADILARFILREAKDSVQTVGKETELVSVTENGQVVRTKYSLAADMFDVPRHLTHCIEPFWRPKKSGSSL